MHESDETSQTQYQSVLRHFSHRDILTHYCNYKLSYKLYVSRHFGINFVGPICHIFENLEPDYLDVCGMFVSFSTVCFIMSLLLYEC